MSPGLGCPIEGMQPRQGDQADLKTSLRRIKWGINLGVDSLE